MSQARCLEYLKTHESATCKELAKALDISVRDAQVCMKKLKQWNYPVDFTMEHINGQSIVTYVWRYTGPRSTSA